MSDGSANEPLEVDVWSDVACPWCWIGRANLRAALELPEVAELGGVVVRHRAFELQPQLPPEGLPAEEFYAQKFGGEEAMRSAFDRVAQVGGAAGLTLRPERMTRAPNTRMAHRLVAIVRARGGAEDAALDALFRLHFSEGGDVSDVGAATEVVARATALDAVALTAAIDAGEALDEVLADEQLAGQLGVQGVPFFAAGRVVAVSGAQPPDVLRQVLAAARERQAELAAPQA